jgi:Tfp pilus assembly protein PilV
MKSSLLRTFFEWALITSVLMSVGFFGWYWLKTRTIRTTNNHMAAAQAELQRNRAVMGLLFAECQAYARTNADMARLLAPPAATQSAAPAPKPGAK